MKREYLKPEIRLLQLRLYTFLAAGSGPSDTAKDTMTDGEGHETTIGEGTQNSRSWGQGMWDNMK